MVIKDSGGPWVWLNAWVGRDLPARYEPVMVSFWGKSEGLPVNTSLPPLSPAPGPNSATKSEDKMI